MEKILEEDSVRKKRVFQKRKIVNGIEFFSCTKCLEFMTRDKFTSGNFGYKCSAICKKCKNSYYINWPEEKKKAKLINRINYYKKLSEACLLARKNFEYFNSSSRTSIKVSKYVLDQISYDISLYNKKIVADNIGISDTIISKLVSGERNKVSLDSARKMVDEYGCNIMRDASYPMDYDFLPPGMTWSKKHKCCIECNSIASPHRSHGICGRCSSRIKRSIDHVTEHNQWAFHHACCVVCKTTSKKHQSRGLCNVCYMRARRNNTVKNYESKSGRGINNG